MNSRDCMLFVPTHYVCICVCLCECGNVIFFSFTVFFAQLVVSLSNSKILFFFWYTTSVGIPTNQFIVLNHCIEPVQGDVCSCAFAANWEKNIIFLMIRFGNVLRHVFHIVDIVINECRCNQKLS